MAPDYAPAPEIVPVDGRDVSRIRTEVRLAHLAIGGLLGEMEGGVWPQVKAVERSLASAEAALEEAIERLGEAIQALNDGAP